MDFCFLCYFQIKSTTHMRQLQILIFAILALGFALEANAQVREAGVSITNNTGDDRLMLVQNSKASVPEYLTVYYVYQDPMSGNYIVTMSQPSEGSAYKAFGLPTELDFQVRVGLTSDGTTNIAFERDGEASASNNGKPIRPQKLW